MVPSESFREFVSETIKALKGTPRRIFMARVADEVGGQRQAAEAFGWGRDTIRKGKKEQDTGVSCIDAFNARGAKPIEARMPRLLSDIRDIAESFTQTDPRFQSDRRYLRLSVPSIVELLIEEKGYEDQELPSNETVRRKLHAMGYTLRKVRKARPEKKGTGDRRDLRAHPRGEPRGG